jgi:transcriptional regulator with XRE-family HTH domain
MSQETLAAKCGAAGWDISRGTYSKIESGHRRVNDAEVVILAKALRCAVTDLLEGHPKKSVMTVLRHGEVED